jgi:hypothetical protein
MKNSFTIEESIELLDSSIQKEMSEVLSINAKALNFQKLVDEKYMEMAKRFEPMLPCKDRVLKIYSSLNEIRLIDRLESMLIREENLKKQNEEDNDGDDL